MANNLNQAPMTPIIPNAPTLAPTGGKNTKTIIIVIIAVVVIIAGYMGFSRWRTERASLNDLSVNENVTNNTIDQNVSGEEIKPMTPAEIFANAEIQEIGDSVHAQIASDIGGIIKAVYGDYKITSFVSGYMGMNSGSGVLQYTIPKLVSVNDASPIAKEMENLGIKITANTQQNDGVSIMAQKDDFTYTVSFNKDEQVVTIIVIKANATPQQ
jgi:hypothetical protein